MTSRRLAFFWPKMIISLFCFSILSVLVTQQNVNKTKCFFKSVKTRSVGTQVSSILQKLKSSGENREVSVQPKPPLKEKRGISYKYLALGSIVCVVRKIRVLNFDEA